MVIDNIERNSINNMKKILLILLLLLHVGAAQGSHPDYETMEREMIARAKLIELVFWGEESIGEHRATLSESDKGRIQDLLLNRTRYIKPLEMSREEYWDGWDDGIVAPVRFLNFIGEDGKSQLQLFIGPDIVPERGKECCLQEIEMIMDNESYNQLVSIIDEYTPLEARKELSDARVED